MAKKMKLNLKDLKVHSFVTALNDNEKEDLKGGTGISYCVCPKTSFTGDPCILCSIC